MNKFSLPVVAAVVRAAAQMVVRRRSRAPGRRARRVQRTIGHVAARPPEDRVNAGRGDGVEGPRVDALPSLVQCRCRKESICENGALLWHLHRIYRLDVLRRVGNASVSMCGFVP